MVPPLLPMSDDERTLLDRAAVWPEHASLTDLDEETLRQVALSQDHDFAVALLYDRLRRSPEHGPFISEVEAPSAEQSRNGPMATLAIVPGAFYRERPETGADGRRVLTIAKRVGCRAERVPLASFGSRADNARILRDWLAARPEERFVLVSLSKGSLDVRTALAAPDAERAFRHVAAWVNLSGLFQGTELVAWLKRQHLRSLLVRIYCWWHGYRFATLAELERDPGRISAERIPLPAHLQLVHVLGFPLRRHLSSPLARRAFARLESRGPNDGGGNLLADAARWPGLVYPVWGTDHYLRAPWDVDGLIARLLLRFLTRQGVSARGGGT